MIAKCPCEHCGVNIEFATEEFLSGSFVTCPKCGKETPIFVSPEAMPAPKPEPVQRLAKYHCQHCDGQITGADIIGTDPQACPACGKDTRLLIPGSREQRQNAAHSRIVHRSPALIENTLDEFANGFFVFGCFGAGVSMLACLIQVADEHMAAAGICLLSAIGFLWQGWLFKVLFRAAAEIVRLLRIIAQKGRP